jgi:hypothetical protein
MKLFFGWKFFDFIIIPKDLEIPKINEVEIMLLSILIQCNVNPILTYNIIKIIINKLSLTNKFIILENPTFSLDTDTYFLNYFNDFKVDLTTKISIITIKNLSSYSLINYSNYLYKISNKNYCVINVSILDTEITPISEINLKNILYIPYLFYPVYNDDEIRFNEVFQIRKNIYKNYTLIDLSVKDIAQNIIDKIKNNKSIYFLCGGQNGFQGIIHFIHALYKTNLLDTFIIESSYVKLMTYKSVNKIHLNVPQLKKYTIEMLEINNIDDEQGNLLYTNLKEKIRNEMLSCNYIINNKLKVKLDNKINLKKYFDKSILPLTYNIGPIKYLFQECELRELIQLYSNSDYINKITIKIIKFISNYCNTHKNKFFILKDANGTYGINITGFNCVDDYDKINYEKKISYLKNLFIEENKIMYKNLQKNVLYQKKNIDNIHNIENINNIKKILNKELIIQEFIQSPQIEFDAKNYNFKSRVYVIVYQQKSQTNIVDELYSYIYKQFTLDLMEYNEINKDNFYNESGDDKLFISNLSDINLLSKYIPYEVFNFKPEEKLKEFINKFNIDINKINKFYKGIFIDENNQFVNNNIYKILAIDIIFDINDDYNIKMLEINTEGALYVEDLEENILNLIYYNNDKAFIKADTTFNYQDEVTYSNGFDDQLYKNKYLKYKYKYLNIKNNL